FFFQAEDVIRAGHVTEFRRVLFRSNGSVSDGPALVRIETFGIIDIPDQPIPDILHRLLRFGRRALLISHLYNLSISLLSLHNQSGFSGIMTPRLFYIDMLACL